MQGIFVMIFVCMEKKDMMYFKLTILLCVGSVVLSAGFHILSRLMRIGFMRDILLDIRRQAFDKILGISYKEFSKESKDVYISHLVNDINTFETNFFINLLNVIYMGGRYVASALLVCLLDIKMGFVMLIISFMMFGIGNLFGKKTESMQLKVTDANEKFTVQASNTFNGLEILKLSGVEERFLDKNMHTINKVENKKMGLSIYTELQRGLMMTLSYSIIMGLVIYMLITVMQGESLGRGMFIFQLCQGMIFPLIEVIPRVNLVKSSIRIYEKITQYNRTEKEEYQNVLPFAFDEQIEVRDLSFSYEGKEILKQANFTLERGKKYLIKGASGAGKSTLLKLLSMIYEDYKGDIVVDGKNYRDMSDKSFNDQVAFVYQDVFLFEDTIANNISLYKDLPAERIEEAARLSGLQEFLDDEPEGIHTKLMENGKNLSGGQRQRISIARAIAKNASILFVDEGTSALNESMGKQIEQELLNLNCTVVAISHRYYEGVSEQYDYVLELKHGVVNTYEGRAYFEEVKAC